MTRIRTGSRSMRVDEVAVVAGMWQTHTDEQIADKLGRGWRTIYNCRIDNGWIKPRQKTPMQIAKEARDDSRHIQQVQAMQALLSRCFA